MKATEKSLLSCFCIIRGGRSGSARSSRRAQWIALAVAGLASPAAAADPFSTDWAPGTKSKARLIATAGDLAGFEIALAPGAITYWRDPGDAGAPPTFDFAGSVNVARVEPVFPAPKRIPESDGGEAFGYENGVVFPLRVEPKDPMKPVTLALRANFAVCEKICVPAQAQLTLTLPGSGSGLGSPYAGLIDTALAAAPRPVAPNAFGELKPDGADGWRLCAPAEAGPPRDLFVEAQAGWWMSAAAAPGEAGRDCFKLALRQQPKDGDPPVDLRLTLTGGAGPVEATLTAPALK